MAGEIDRAVMNESQEDLLCGVGLVLLSHSYKDLDFIRRKKHTV
jgi:hypothetical protein